MVVTELIDVISFSVLNLNIEIFQTAVTDLVKTVSKNKKRIINDTAILHEYVLFKACFWQKGKKLSYKNATSLVKELP